ncbi:unnamed protein product [Peronospora destructor]|uniref:DML1/Misato tubulin domain-containing protein n=1 Tax=Peronospora destructor TaxID=86335 RepID=A0AAV0T4Q1_9STRA|nr:unnamed protein product [Peronospora destructor]
MEETLRLQFGTAATTIGTQWLALQEANEVRKTPHVLSFEAKGRVQRQIRAAPKQRDGHTTWDEDVQVYDQSRAEPVANDGLWSWGRLQEHNLVEVDEFRQHMPLHNFYEGHAVSNGGNIENATLEEAEDRVRTVLEACDQLTMVQGLVDMDSSWGGLAHEIMTYIAEECPGVLTVVVGNNWSYPMATDDKDALFRVAPIVRDRTKVEARNATVVATALEQSISTHRGRPAYEMMEGFHSSRKVVEVCASFPHTTDPTTLLQSIHDGVTNEVRCNNSMNDDPFHNCSLLPSIQQRSGRPVHEDNTDKTYYRRLRFRGAFTGYPSLRSTIDTYRISTRDIALHWSDTSPLRLPPTYRLQMVQNSSVDAISQLVLSSRTGIYLRTIADLVAKSDKRTLFEFTRAGMSPDALKELEATLAGMGDAYFTE